MAKGVETVITFVFEPESFKQLSISQIGKMVSSREAKFQLHYWTSWLQI